MTIRVYILPSKVATTPLSLFVFGPEVAVPKIKTCLIKVFYPLTDGIR